MTRTTLALFCATFTAALSPAADFPATEINNGQIRAKIYLPDAKNGFYRSTRFDWSGVIGSLEFKGHNYYGPWFQSIDPNVYDFGYNDGGVVSAQMVIEHNLKNTGSRAIRSNMYNHNFLVLDNQPPGPDFVITFPFQIQARRAPNQALGEIRGNQLVYVKTLADRERMTTQMQ